MCSMTLFRQPNRYVALLKRSLSEEEAVALPPRRQAGAQRRPKGTLVCLPLGDANHLAVIGDNGKLLVFPVAEFPEMSRARASSCRATAKAA
jgi:hypothetical protein